MIERTVDFSNLGFAYVKFDAYLQAGLKAKHIVNSSWVHTQKPDMDKCPYPVIGTFHGDGLSHYIFSYSSNDQDIISFIYRSGNIELYVTGDELSALQDITEQFKTWFPKNEPTDDTVPVEFYYNTHRGPQAVGRDMNVPKWESIKGNYTSEVQNQLEALIKDFTPSHGGQLILLQGKPGTGKTFAIRSIIKEWAGWCESTVIVDPDAFFGEANYLMNVILQNRDSFDIETPEGIRKEEMKWNLIILEDAGEMLSKDARSRVGQGLSRLLNLTEGLIGQGLKILVLISTNEELRELHDAVSRPGRCAAQIEFSAFSGAEANNWRIAHGLPEKSAGIVTLADLYSELEGYKKPKELAAAGFNV